MYKSQALDWSKNVFSSSNENYPNDVIQVVKKDNPSTKVYQDRNGIYIYEVNSLDVFFEDLTKINTKFLAEKVKINKSLAEAISKIEDPSDVLVNKFIDDKRFRLEILKVLAKFTSPVISGFISFLTVVFDKLWIRAEPNGAFSAYDENLIVQLDILTSLEFAQIPPALVEMIAYNLDRVGYYVGTGFGESHAAARTFKARKGELSKEVVDELENIALQHSYSGLYKLIRKIRV